MVIALLIFALFTVINMTVFRLAEQEIAQLERTIILKEAEVCTHTVPPSPETCSLSFCYYPGYASCSCVMLPVRL